MHYCVAGFFAKLFSSKEERKDTAKESYEHAANCFRQGKDCTIFLIVDERASEAFIKMAELEPSEILAAHTLMTAVDSLKGRSVNKSNDLLKRVAELYSTNGRFRSAAKCYQQIAEGYNNENDYKLAVEAYLKAADFEELENEGSNLGVQAIQNAADLIIRYDTERLTEAIPVTSKP